MNYDIQFFEEEHRYLVNGVEYPSVTELLTPMSDAEYGKINPSILESAARRGTLVHEYAELMDYDSLPDEIEGDIIPYLMAYKKFLRDYKPDWRLIETPVFCEEGFVGTLDRCGVIDGEMCIVDIKTLQQPTKMNKFTVCTQTNAYSWALLNTYDIPTSRRYALYLGKDGEYSLMDCLEYETKYGFDAVKALCECLTLNNLKRKIQDYSKMKPIKKGKK